jgi:aspartate beta-hydroxylase
MADIYDRTATIIRQIYDRRITTPPVLDMESNFPDGRKFAAAWQAIREEALTVGRRLQEVPRFHEIMREQTAISANDGRDWRLFILKAYGIENPQNMEACPMLASVVAAAPDVLSASISFMAPNKHIPAHRGPFRGVLRFYLPLVMPKAGDGLPAAVLKIDGSEYRLADGQCMLWDDTYPHEVWNPSEEVRIVLLLDVRRPNMPIDMALFSGVLMTIVRWGIRFRGLS